MNGILAQLITLVTHGNNFLKNNVIPTDFDSNNIHFKHCNSINFRLFNNASNTDHPEGEVIAILPSQWFEYLKKLGC